MLALRRIMRERNVSLVHTHSSVDSWLASLAAKSLGLPIVRSRHVSIRILPRRALVYRLADRILTSGEGVRQMVAAAGIAPDRIVSVPASFDPGRFHPDVSGDAVRRELGLEGPAIGLVANIRGSKGHQYFLEAAHRVLARVPATRFLIVGDGVGFDEVRSRVRARGLEGVVIMTGFRRDIPEVMAALDVLVLPSTRSEATSQVILQALAVGTPVVATAIGGSPEVIHEGQTGRLVPPNDAEALAAAILATFNDHDGSRAMARRGQAHVRARLSMDAQMGVTTSVYRELLHARR